jgi:Tfp pilus assembly protein FimT
MARKATTMSEKRPMAPHRNNAAYTLLEILLALGVIAVLMGIAVPALMDSFGKSPMEEVSDDIARTVQAVRSSAVDQSEARRIASPGTAYSPREMPPSDSPKDGCSKSDASQNQNSGSPKNSSFGLSTARGFANRSRCGFVGTARSPSSLSTPSPASSSMNKSGFRPSPPPFFRLLAV